MIDRSDFIKGLRDAADFLDAHPGVAVPHYPALSISTHGTDEEDRAAVDAFAAAAGVTAAYVNEERTHYEAELHFGPIVYSITGITEAAMAEHSEIARLGEEALAAKKAAARVDEADWAALGDCIADGDDEDRDDQCDGCGNRLDDCTCAPGFVPQEPSMWSDPAVHVDEADWEALGDCIADNADDLADAAARAHMMPFTQSGRDTGHALCGAAEGGVTHDDNEVTCIACLEGAEEQYDDVRGRAEPVHAVGVFADLAVAGEVPAREQ